MSDRFRFRALRGWSIGARLTFSSLIFVLPIALLSYFVVSTSYESIRLTRMEKDGNAYIRPLAYLQQQIAEHERLVGQHFAAGVDEGKLRSLEQGVDARFEALEALHADVAERFKLDEAGLAERGRQRLAVAELADRWEYLKGWNTLTPGKMIGRHAGLYSDLHELIELVGGTSSLGLDPDQDSSALVRLLLEKLPRTQAIVSDVLSYYETAQDTGEISEMARQEFLLLGAELRRVGYENVLDAGRTALEEDEFYHGSSPSLQENLAPLLRRYEANARDFLEYVNMLSDSARWSLVRAPVFLQSALQLKRTARELSETASAELDVLLERRQQDDLSMLWIIGGMCGGALLVAFVLVVLIGRSIVRPLGRIGRFTRRIAEEDFTATLEHGFSGELAELAENIRAMLTTLKRLGFAQALLEGMTYPCFVVDTDYRLTFVNRPMLELLERRGEPGDFLGADLREFFYNGEEGPMLAQQVQADRSPVVGRERIMITDAGNRRHLRVDAAPLYDLEGALMGSFTLAADLTSVKENEERIREQVRTMGQVAEEAGGIADEVAVAANGLRGRVQEVNDGSERQKDRTVETMTAMEQMNASVAEVARNASQAAADALTAIDRAGEGERIVEKVIASIRQVSDHAEGLGGSMRDLNKEASGIGTVMGVIEDIADQTNLLALNAAIEAARAGDAGRGFAVVADEVRKLAEKTMDATKQVGRAINSIQQSTEESVQATENAVTAVRSSTEDASEAGVALREIVRVIEGNSEQIRAIATAAEQQASTSEEISRSIGGIDGVCDEAVLLVGRSLDAIEQLARLSEDLREVISRMRNE